MRVSESPMKGEVTLGRGTGAHIHTTLQKLVVRRRGGKEETAQPYKLATVRRHNLLYV